jgi:hypothetical protein
MLPAIIMFTTQQNVNVNLKVKRRWRFGVLMDWCTSLHGVHWDPGLLEYWCASLLIYWSTVILELWCTIPEYWSTAVLESWFTRTLRHYSTGVMGVCGTRERWD